MADLLVLFDSGRVYEHSQEIATMLRQQQAEIDTLKNPIMQAIALSFEPAKTLTDDPLVNWKPVWQEKPELTLTDEEITEEWAKFYPDVFHTHLIDFARAIIKKASEK